MIVNRPASLLAIAVLLLGSLSATSGTESSGSLAAATAPEPPGVGAQRLDGHEVAIPATAGVSENAGERSPLADGRAPVSRRYPSRHN